MNNQYNLKIYRLWSLVYDAAVGRVFNRPRQRAIELLQLQRGERLFLSGAGTGLDLPLIPSGVWVTAVDLSHPMLQKARGKGNGRLSFLRRTVGSIITKFGTDPNRRLSDEETDMSDSTKIPAQNGRIRLILAIQKGIYYLSKYWFPLFLAVPAVILALGFLAPALMAQGNGDGATAVYRFLALDNHQMPDRSYFLFGQSGGIQTYTPETLIANGADLQDWEAFIGNESLGYKTGLNHRMIAILVGIVAGGLAWGFSKRKLKISLIIVLSLTLPLLIDGFSHLISEAGALDVRATNEWAAVLSNRAFSEEFYQGDMIGSLNYWLRTGTGLLFGLGTVLFLFNRFDIYFRAVRQKLEPRLRKAGVI